jgi:hypothetical protein
MIFIEQNHQTHLENLRHFELYPLTKTYGISGILGQNIALLR